MLFFTIKNNSISTDKNCACKMGMQYSNEHYYIKWVLFSIKFNLKYNTQTITSTIIIMEV